MPAKIFARLRLRRGNFSDLPNPLLGAELGWCVDTQQLFIGNGALADGAPDLGNTQILTQASPNFQILQYNYISNTLTIADTSQSIVLGTVSVSDTLGHTGSLIINSTSVTLTSSYTIQQVANAINIANITNVSASVSGGLYIIIIGSFGQAITIGSGSTTAILTALGISAITTSASPSYRSLQQVLDDRVSVKDYGAKGDGSTDDSIAINQAILDLYTAPLAIGQLAQSRRRILFFPAGVYKVIAEKIVLPPHCKLQGEGRGATQIILDATSTLDHIFQTCDGLGQTGTSIGTNSAEFPNDISIDSIGFVRSVYGAIGNLNRFSGINFRKCLFNSGWTTGSGSNIFDLDKLGSVVLMNDMTFDECEFTAHYDIFTFNNAINFSDIFFIDCYIHDSYRGIYINNSVKNVKITSNRFVNLSDRGIYANANSSLVNSVNNSFVNVGITNNVSPIELTSSATQCSSVSDTFDTGLNSIINNSINGLTQNAYGNGKFQNITYSPRTGPITLTDNTTAGATGFVLSLTSFIGIYIDYVLIRNGDYRIGTMNIATDGSANAYLYDMNGENSTSGTLFSVTVSGGNVNLLYTTSSTGYNAQFYYTYRYF